MAAAGAAGGVALTVAVVDTAGEELGATATGFAVLGGTTIGVTVVVAATTVGWLVAPVLVLQHT